ncbi:MAG: chromate transporter [Treponema sp.]|nr:chromate transporter [Treponema sp.]
MSKNKKDKKDKKEFFKILVNLFLSFFKIGSFTIGGGLAMLPMMEKELINKKKWINDEELLDYYAVSQSTPGIIAVNVATFVGYKEAGIIGGIFATLGVITPSWIIITILAFFINSISDYPMVQKALKGVNVAVAALLTSVIIKFSKKTIKNVYNAIFMLISFVLVFFFKVPSFWIIIAALLIGVLLVLIQDKKKIKNQNLNEENKIENSEEVEK